MEDPEGNAADSFHKWRRTSLWNFPRWTHQTLERLSFSLPTLRCTSLTFMRSTKTLSQKVTVKPTAHKAIQAGAQIAHKVLDKYYLKCADHSHIYIWALLLHPQRRMKYLKMINWDKEWMNDAEKTLYDFWDRYYKPDVADASNETVAVSYQEDFDTLAQYNPQLAASGIESASSGAENPVKIFIHATADPLRKDQWNLGFEEIDPHRYHYRLFKKASDNIEKSFHRCAMDICAVPAHTLLTSNAASRTEEKLPLSFGF
ncbi:hypothetical protein BT69DRAFT_167431 [Atractiella rhizophila]|nr:hypothetical protein BT69DRAFT_167431 [Atractiella rhizophila]